MEALEAYQLAAQLHTGQVDKAGRPYIEHLTRVFLRVQAAGGVLIQQIAALLHDVIEDGHATADDLVRIAGVPVEAVEIVVTLSRRADQPYLDYLATVKASPRAALVKLADLEDNGDPARLGLLPEEEGLRLRKKYAQAVRFMTEA